MLPLVRREHSNSRVLNEIIYLREWTSRGEKRFILGVGRLFCHIAT